MIDRTCPCCGSSVTLDTRGLAEVEVVQPYMVRHLDQPRLALRLTWVASCDACEFCREITVSEQKEECRR